MTDLELLERAAKAAGEWSDKEPLEHIIARWNPLTDDGDALRLAVKLRLEVWLTATDARALAYDLDSKPMSELVGSDPYAATRRAIVRAAAAMEQS